MTEEEFIYPWESKIELTAFIGLVSTLLVAFGLVGLSAEQIAALSSFGFILIMIWRKYSNSCIVWVKEQLD